MDKNTLIEIRGVSKKFSRNLDLSLKYGVCDIMKDLLEVQSKADELRKGEFWALKDLSFELRKGQTMGVIGPNGSGKTTLLKLLSGIFMPDEGEVKVRGRVGSIIEIGAGFHPMLSGIENIYVNGAILGMSKKEVDKKIDSIIDFADIGKFINSPVKFYSYGMYLRLGFAIAVHCDLEILLIDEILAVGDAAFRSKCYRKMNEIKSRNEAAIVFVSHDLFMVDKFCNHGICLDEGRVNSKGKIGQVLMDYQSLITNRSKQAAKNLSPEMLDCTKETAIRSVRFLGSNRKEKREFAYGDAFGVKIEYEVRRPVDGLQFELSIFNRETVRICNLDTLIDGIEVKPASTGKGTIECWVKELPLLADNYYIVVHIYDSRHISLIDYWSGMVKPELSFQVLPSPASAIMGDYKGICHFPVRWVVKKKQ